MFILNITFKTTWGIHVTWMDWLKSNWLKKMEGPETVSVRIVRLLDVEEQEGPTMAVQISTETLAGLEELEMRWIQDGQPLMHTVWGTECVHFATKMEVVQ